jgi:tetratricopeptide (TPR) repeat protein
MAPRRYPVEPAKSSALRARAFLLACTATGAWILAAGAALAASATVRGAEMAGYGRAVFDFDSLPKASVRTANNVLVISFDKPVSFAQEKLTIELPNYVSAVRVDPDGKAIRFALQRPFKPSMMEAGDKLFVDLLPETWKGMPPGLPQDVIDQLSKRAKEAEETARMLARKRASEEPKDLAFRIGTTPTFTRVVFEMPQVAPVEMTRAGDLVEIVFDAPLRLDAARLRAALPPLVTSVETEPLPGGMRLTLGIPAATDVRGFREDENYSIDIATPKAAPKVAAKPGDAKPADAKAPEAKGPDVKVAEAKPGAAGGSEGMKQADRPGEGVSSPESPPRGTHADAAGTPAGAPTPATPEDLPLVPFSREDRAGMADAETPLKVGVVAEHGTVRLNLPLSAKVPLAVFDRAGVVWIAAETKAPFDPTQIGMVAPGLVSGVDVRRVGRLSILRLTLARTPLVRATAAPGSWVVTLGDEVAGPSEAVRLGHGIDSDGRTVVRADYKDAGGVHWVEDPEVGDRIAVVTGRNTARSLDKAQSFVDFKAIATAQGLAIVPNSDDVAVKVGVDDVTIMRDGGLAVSIAVDQPTRKPALERKLVVDAETWRKSQAGDIRERGRALMRAASESSKHGRGDARLDYARFLVANRLAPEALGVLSVTTSDEPDLARDRSAMLLTAIANIFADRFDEAGKILASEGMRDDPEGILWRAYLDAIQQRWQQSLVGFRRSEAPLAAYPEDLQSLMGPAYAEAAIVGRDFGLAQRVLDRMEGLEADPLQRQRAILLGARVAEGLGRVDEALATYAQLADKAERPVQARARLARAALALKDRSITRLDAIAELEGVAVTWRGDSVEAEALALLGRLYAEEERWREAFSAARRANELYPDSDFTRALYDDTGSRFEALFLDNKADTIPRLDAIALYFDFKEFTPPGRRGDEMIRRLAERLVSLDLLTEAADLLQHQVDNRLSGAARSSVATRLAVIRLMNRQPAKAYEALKDTRLSELPADLRRARSLLEARALSDLSRTDLALEMLASEEGADVDRLRTDILWQSRRWREAGEAYERLLGDAWQTPAPLEDAQRADVLRAAIAYGLGEENLSLDRLRAKFSTKMSDSADARAFTVLTAPEGAISGEYRDIAKQVATADTLSEFLGEFRKRYPDTPLVPARQPQGGKPAAPEAPAAADKPADGAKPQASGGEKPADGAKPETAGGEKPAAGAQAPEKPAEGSAPSKPSAGAQGQAPAQG